MNASNSSRSILPVPFTSYLAIVRRTAATSSAHVVEPTPSDASSSPKMGEGRDDEEEEEDRHVAREAARKGRGGVRTTPRGRVGLVKRSAPCSASLGARPRGDNTTSDRCRHDDWVWGGGHISACRG